MENVQTFYADAEPLVKAINDFAKRYGLIAIAAVDHFCYKCGSHEVFEQTRALLEPESAFVYQSYISGRRIAILKLKKGLKTGLGEVTTLELSDQKPDNSQTTGFNHVEIYPVGVSYDELVSTLRERGATLQKTERPHHTTYDIALGQFNVKLTQELLIEKIKKDEMN